MTVPLSVCAHHVPLAIVDGIAADGTLHLSSADFTSLRRASTLHIGECRRGPIVAIPVRVDE